MKKQKINPFDILSGKVVKNKNGIFWFKDAGNNVDINGWPIYDKLHRDNDLPAIIQSMVLNNGIETENCIEIMTYLRLYIPMVLKPGGKMENDTEIMIYRHLYNPMVPNIGIEMD